MKRVLCLFLMFIAFIPNVEAKRGCCSHHGGVAGCNSNGRTICNDGTLSPTCTCTATPKYIYGCTDKSAKNYNKNANKNDGTCIYYVYGCTDKTAKNYNPKAEKSNNSCKYYIEGCTDKAAKNYNSKAEKDDGSCEYDKVELDNNQDTINNNNIENNDSTSNNTVNKQNSNNSYSSYIKESSKTKKENEQEEISPIWVVMGVALFGGYLYIKKR